MNNNHLLVGFLTLLIVLFGALSALLLIDTHIPSTQRIQTISHITTAAVAQSEETVGVLITVDEEHIDQVVSSLKAKGATVNKHKVGRVIAANVPHDSMQGLSAEGITVLPNRAVQGFSIQEISETNIETFWNAGFTGKGVVVAVIDTGINTDNVVAARDFVGSGTTHDDNGHGTKIAEIILAMAPDVKFINAKVLDAQLAGSEASVIAGINYAVEQGADVISLSLGGLFDDLNSPLVAAVEDAVQQGITVVVAVGNCGTPEKCDGFTGVATPGNARDVISVGAVDGIDVVSYSSGNNYGDYIKPDVVAPVSGNALTGTSAATPFVSGAAALLIERYHASPVDVKRLLEEHATDLGVPGKDSVFGSGKLNLQDLLDAVVEEQQEIVPVQQTVHVPTTNRAVTGFSAGAASYAGQWHMFRLDTQMIGLEYGLQYSPLHAEYYNQTQGFLYVGKDIFAFDGKKATYSSFGGEVIRDVKIISPTRAYLIGLDVIKSYNITQWMIQPLPAHKSSNYWESPKKGFELRGVDFNSIGTTGFSVGINYSGAGVVLKKQGATDWAIENFAFAPLRDVKFVNRTLAFAIGGNVTNPAIGQKIYRWTNGVWTTDYTDTAATNELLVLDAIANNFVVAVGKNGKIMRWNGAAWSVSVSPTTKTLHDVSFYNTTLGYAVGANATILKYTGTWSIQSEGGSFINQHYCFYVNVTSDYCQPVVDVNVTFTDVRVFSPTTGFLFGNGLGKGVSGQYNKNIDEFKLQPSAPTLSVPKLDLIQNMTLTINLKDHSDADSFVLNTGNCAVVGNNLQVLPPLNFVGLMTCKVTATKASLSASQNIPIEVHAAGPLADLAVLASDIVVAKTTDPETINITVHNLGRLTATSVGVKLIELKNNAFVQEATQSLASIANRSSKVASFSLDVQRGSTLVAVVDYANAITESSESNNRAEGKYKSLDVFLNITTQTPFISVIRSYLQETLSEYNVVTTSASAEVILNVGYEYGSKTRGCVKGMVYAAGNAIPDVHAGLIFTTQNNGITITTICAPRVEGLVNAIKRLNKEDVTKNKETLFERTDLGAIAMRDFFASKIANAELVHQALAGPVTASEEFVETMDSTPLRLKHYKPIVSQNFLDYLFNIENNKPWLSPVVMAGGLWSDITAWDEAGKEIAIGMDDGYVKDTIKYAPRDVWLIELTGGPGTECTTCTDYTYGDVVSKHWPASVGGVIKLTGKYPLAYVGHSNGGRIGLEGLKNYSASGKASAGKLSNGTVFNLPANAVDMFIGVGVPGAFSGNSPFANRIARNKDQINSNLQSKGLSHLTIGDIGAQFIQGLSSLDTNGPKISFNLWKRYASFINLTTDTQPGSGVNLDKTLMIAGNLFKTHDEIVPVSDVNAVYSNINVNVGAGNKKVLVYVWDGHLGMAETKAVKSSVKQFLNDDVLTQKIENQVNG